MLNKQDKHADSLNLVGKVKLLCVMYLSVWVTSPFLAFGSGYRAIALFAALVWVFFELQERESVFFYPPKYLFWLFIYLFVTVFLTFYADGVAGLNRNIQLYIMFFFILLYASYEKKSISILKPVIYLNMLLFLVWLITTYIGLMENSHASRAIIRSNEESMQLTKKGIGGFALIYSMLIYIILLIAMIKYRLKRHSVLSLVNVFLYFSLFMSVITVLKAQYSTAVIIVFFSSAFYLLYSDNRDKNIFLVVTLLTAFILIKLYIVDILYALLPYAEGTNYRFKIQDMITTINLGEATGTAAYRTERYIRSFFIFLENPLLGVWSIESVGKHSLILDNFAQFGLIIGSILLYVLFKIPYQTLKRQKKNTSLSLTILFIMVVLCTVNNIAMSYGFMFFILYPYILSTLEND